jgi:hypothetical protein
MFPSLLFPLHNLVGVYLEPLRKISYGLLALEGFQGYLHLEYRGMISPGSFAHITPPLSFCIIEQFFPLMSLSSFSRPAHKALEVMNRTGNSRLLVVDGDELAGIIS